jgi:type II secretory ATPase GspE/PulE/Tfp pilus assembly ATPase PilB-like protein
MAAFKSSRGAAAQATSEKKRRLKPASLEATGGTPTEVAARRKAAGKTPGFRKAREAFAAASAKAATGLLFDLSTQASGVRWRIDNVWQDGEPIERDHLASLIAAVKALVTAGATAMQGTQEGEIIVGTEGIRRSCRVTVRTAPAGEQVLCVLGAELGEPPRRGLGAELAGLFGRFLPGRAAKAAEDAAKALPQVSFDVARDGDPARLEQATGAEAYPQACALIAAAVKDRASDLVIDFTKESAAVHRLVDGVTVPAKPLDRTAGDAVLAVLKTIAGLDPKERRGRQSGQCVTVIEGKPWPCRIVSQGVPTGERVQIALDYGRPKFKSIADTGMPPSQIDRVRHLLALEKGLIVVATPKRGGLSTLFDMILTTADRLLRDFVAIEDAASPGAEIQNVKVVRWDAAKQVSPAMAVDEARRGYPGALACCDVKDADLAAKLVAAAAEGLLVVIGIRGEDAVDGLTNLMKLGIAPETLAQVLLGAVGGRLVRKLCPKCKQEYLPPLELMAKFKGDVSVETTFSRAAKNGCSICTGTGYVGRTGIFEIASGPTLNRYLAKKADGKVLRQAALKDGMRPLQQEGIARVADSVTSIEEIQRAFKKA